MFGIDVGADDFDYEKYENNKYFDVVFDGMSGEYCIVGKILAQANDDGEGFEMLEINEKILSAYNKTVLAENISKELGKHYSVDDFKLLLFSHYS